MLSFAKCGKVVTIILKKQYNLVKSEKKLKKLLKNSLQIYIMLIKCL